MRYWEIDFLRGLALVLMLVFNYAYALALFNIYSVRGGWLFWFLFPHVIGAMFVFLVGVSFTISYSKLKKKGTRDVYKKYLLRGSKIFGLGLLITLVTWIFARDATIFFGVLHLIGISVMLAPLFRKFTKTNLWLGLLLIAVGIYLRNLSVSYPVSYPWLLWLGLMPENFQTLDYFPLLPWFGVVLLGIFAGNTLYAKGKRMFRIREMSHGAGLLCFLGRHSLIIYLLHQPVLIAILYALGFSPF
jgi:uncharacterized membrane protein